MHMPPPTQEKLKQEQNFLVAEWLIDGGEMGQLMRSMDWSKTPLGAIDSWPQSLRTTVGLCLSSSLPIALTWGKKHVQIYNDGYAAICGGKHPHSMGQEFRECWASAWPEIGEFFDRALLGESSYIQNQRTFLDRYGFLEETFFSFSFSSIRDETGGIGGLFYPVTETTSQMLKERRMRTLVDLVARTAKAESVEDVFTCAARVLGENSLDLPFVLFYLLDEKGDRARLCGNAGLAPGTAASPEIIDLKFGKPEDWPLAMAVRSGRCQQVDGLTDRFIGFASGPYPEPPELALVIPIGAPGAERPLGVLIAGVSPRLTLAGVYRAFYERLAAAVGTALADALSHMAERKRAEALAELDRTKTAFFGNVSHEFRTPLTLIMSPLEEILRGDSGYCDEIARENLTIAHRNSLRLLRLVNTLLDFMSIEAGRVQALYEATDLHALTADLASVFRSAIEKAGLVLVVDCAPLSQPVYVDRDMWEKVVLNLLSNAFKHTLSGGIRVSLREKNDHVELIVADTGTGIPADALPHVFERFYRVPNSRGRTHEGTGIGLALVHELLRLHGGSIGVESCVDVGTTFTVTIPLGTAHLPPDRIKMTRSLAASAMSGEDFLEEVMRWLPEQKRAPGEGTHRAFTKVVPEPMPPTSEARARGLGATGTILLVDDNADMRSYVKRILAARFLVITAANGLEALRAAIEHKPDLILTDVMMPDLDGFALLKALRADARTASLPVMMLSARAGEEARLEAIDAGVDDYLIKPFSARELLAKVSGVLALAMIRNESSAAQKRVEQALREADHRKDEFLATLAHELRNPLAPIRNALQMFNLEGFTSAIQRHAYEVIERQLSQLVRLVDDLLDVSRITQGKLELHRQHVLLDAVIQTAVETARPIIEAARHTLRVDMPAAPIRLYADPLRLSQAFANLLTNSARYTPTGGHIYVMVEPAYTGVEVRIMDDGIGIPKESLRVIFDMFTQLEHPSRHAASGLGIGLALVRTFVEMHEGSVRAESDGANQGSTFTVWLPTIKEAAVHGDTMTNQMETPMRIPKRRVLVVDDNIDAAESMCMLLKLMGHETQQAHDGKQAVAAAQTFSPDLILMDIGMPHMDGLEAARQIRLLALSQRPVIVALTGWGQDADRRRSQEAGVDHHLVKPLDIKDLNRLLNDLG